MTDPAVEGFPPAGTTGLGSMPGTSARDSAGIAAGEFDIAFLPELPARGPGADMVGRALGLIVSVATEFAGETTPTGWRLAGALEDSGRAMRRAASFLGEDLDALEERLDGHEGLVKIAICGPWTVAAMLELPSGEKLIRDHGARRDLVEAQAEAVSRLLSDVQRRLPKARLVLQIDEPLLPAVLRGRVKTQSGLQTYRSIDIPEASTGLSRLVAAAEDRAIPVAHCCAGEDVDIAIEAFVKAGFTGLSLDMKLHRAPRDEALAEAIDSGITLFAGLLPSVDSPLPARGRFDAKQTLEPLLAFGSRVGFGQAEMARACVLTPTCGFAGASPGWVRRVAADLREAGKVLGAEGDVGRDG